MVSSNKAYEILYGKNGSLKEKEKMLDKMRRELAKNLKVSLRSVDFIKSDTDEIYYFEVDGADYSMVEDMDTAHNIAFDRVLEDIENEPEIFDKSFMSNYVYMTDTDRRVFANEESDHIVESMDEDDIIKRAGYDDEIEEIQDQIDELDEDAEDYDDKKEELEAKGEEILKKAKEELLEEYYDEIYEETSNPMRYFVYKNRMYSAEDLLDLNFISIDKEEMAEDAVNMDGEIHFLSSYDDEIHETKSGFVYWRTN